MHGSLRRGLRFQPAVRRQVDPVPDKHDPLFFQERLLTLVVSVSTGKGDSSLGVDDAMPGNVHAVGQVMKSISHETGMTGETASKCDFPVRGHSSSRDSSHRLPDPAKEIAWRVHQRARRLYFDGLCKLGQFLR